MNILLGADPEVFYKKDGSLVSAHGLVKGTKETPYPVCNGAVQVDGMALEFNIDPASTSDEWVFNLESVMAQLSDMVEGSIDISPVAEFGYEYINKQPEEARVLGCEPDYNAWTGGVNPAPDMDTDFRTGAGHIHIGFTEDCVETSDNHMELCERIVKQLDARLGLVSLILDPCTKRRELYGKAGAYRPKTYGLEYRVLSNFWLKSGEMMHWVYSTVHEALEDTRSGILWEDKYPDIAEIINRSDVESATSIIKQEGWRFPNV